MRYKVAKRERKRRNKKGVLAIETILISAIVIALGSSTALSFSNTQKKVSEHAHAGIDQAGEHVVNEMSGLVGDGEEVPTSPGGGESGTKR